MRLEEFQAAAADIRSDPRITALLEFNLDEGWVSVCLLYTSLHSENYIVKPNIKVQISRFADSETADIFLSPSAVCEHGGRRK